MNRRAFLTGGLLHVRRGQRFRTIDPRTNKMCIEATATDDGEPGLDAIGQQCGQVYFDESTAVYEGAS